MGVKNIINRWFSSWVYCDYTLWHKELHDLYANFPYLEKVQSSVNYKQQYDKLYAQVYNEQRQAFEYLLENSSSSIFDENSKTYQDMKNQAFTFKRSTVISRKRFLSLWNHQLISHYLGDLDSNETKIKLSGITELPEASVYLLGKKLPNLKDLHIEKCAFSELPSNFGKFSNLEKLTIVQTPLLGLPHAFSWLRKLKKLIIEDTELSRFPEVLARMPALKELKLANNLITTMPDALLVEQLLSKAGLSAEEILKSQRGAKSSLPAYWLDRFKSQSNVSSADVPGEGFSLTNLSNDKNGNNRPEQADLL